MTTTTRLQFEAIVLGFVATFLVLMAGAHVAWPTAGVSVVGLLMLPAAIGAGLLVVYFDWRATLRHRFLARRDDRGEPASGARMHSTPPAIAERDGVAAVVPTLAADRAGTDAGARQARLSAERALDEVLADSFPASDPPSWNPGTSRPPPADVGTSA